jgi:hypothetical protein
MKKILVTMLVVSTFGCALEYNPRYYYNEIQVVNLTPAEITDVKVGLVGTDRSLACEEVLKNAMCAKRYGKRIYPQQGIQLSWVHTDGGRKAEVASPSVPVTYSTAFPLRIVVEIDAQGSLKSFFEQDEPGRGIYLYD